MTTFIPYQPWENAPSFNGRTFRKSPTVSLPSRVLWRQSLQDPEWARPWSKPDFVELVDLTASDHQDAVREYLVDREILEPMVPDSAEQCVRVTGDGGRNRTDSDNEHGNEDDSEGDNEGDIEHGDDDDIEHGNNDNKDDDDNDSDHNSEASDLPSLEDIFAQLDKERMARKERCRERCREGDSTDRANPAATAASSLWPAANQDNLIMPDDDKAANTHEVAAPNARKPSFEVADLVDRCGPSPTLLGVLTEPGTDDGKNAQNSLAQYLMDSYGEDKEERGGDLHEDEVSRNKNVACGDSGGDGIGLNAPASAGLIHNVFAEYKKTFGMAGRKQKATGSAPYDGKDSNTAAGSIPQPITLEEPRAVTDDGVTSMEQPTEVTRDDVGPREFSRELKNRFIS